MKIDEQKVDKIAGEIEVSPNFEKTSDEFVISSIYRNGELLDWEHKLFVKESTAWVYNAKHAEKFRTEIQVFDDETYSHTRQIVAKDIIIKSGAPTLDEIRSAPGYKSGEEGQVCKECGIWKPFSDFYSHKDKKTGAVKYLYKCKPCHIEDGRLRNEAKKKDRDADKRAELDEREHIWKDLEKLMSFQNPKMSLNDSLTLKALLASFKRTYPKHKSVSTYGDLQKLIEHFAPHIHIARSPNTNKPDGKESANRRVEGFQFGNISFNDWVSENMVADRTSSITLPELRERFCADLAVDPFDPDHNMGFGKFIGKFGFRTSKDSRQVMDRKCIKGFRWRDFKDKHGIILPHEVRLHAEMNVLELPDNPIPPENSIPDDDEVLNIFGVDLETVDRSTDTDEVKEVHTEPVKQVPAVSTAELQKQIADLSSQVQKLTDALAAKDEEPTPPPPTNSWSARALKFFGFRG